MEKWYAMTGQQVLSSLKTSRMGLDEAEGAARLEKYGKNVLEEKGQLMWWQVFLAQFKDLLVMILIAAAAVSMMTGDPESAMVIFAVLLLNALLGTIEHLRAGKSLEGLKQLSSPQARVIRNGQARTIPSAELVLGDILVLEPGDLAAADGRLLEVYSLMVNESSLTGESLSVEKDCRLLKNGNNAPAIADQTNMVFSGGRITGGRAVAVVTATGMDTEIGKIASLMNETGEQNTPLQISLNRFSGHLAAAIIGICAVVFLLSLYRREPVMDALMFAVALAVAAIPEALSSIVTIVQAMGTQRMAKEQAIIKDLKAVESLGCVSVICSDKTGTLTRNRMDVEQVYINQRELEPARLGELTGRLDARLFLYSAVLNNNAPAEGRGTDGDPVEAALLRMAGSAGVIPEQVRLQCPRKWELPFDSARKMMITVNRVDGREITFVKGAVDVLLSRCSRMVNPARAEEVFLAGQSGLPSRELSGRDRSMILAQNESWSEKGFRVLALGCGLRSPGSSDWGKTDDFLFLGMAAMMDPPRPQSRPAVLSARQAGILPVMITGDHKVTALAIARRIGILGPGDLAVTGAELNAMDEKELSGRLEHISVYARVSPEHKIRIVDAWQKKGRIVAMTGDGVNDAPALKKADIGIAMGIGGTEVSKDAASMILADDNFATIIKAVSNGRNVYRNIKNAIQFLLSGNMAGILCVLYTTFRALPLPFAPVHLLFINLITDSLPAIAIGMEPAGEELLKQPPRDPKEGILTASFVRTLLFQGGLIAGATMWAYSAGLRESGESAACTMAFSTLILARLFHGFNCRGEYSVIRLGLLGNPGSIMAFLVGTLLLAAVLFVPALAPMFAVAPLNAGQVILAGTAAFLPTLVIQLVKVQREWSE